MGTYWSVDLYSDFFVVIDDLQSALENVLAQIVSECSHWDPASHLSRFNRSEPGTRMPLPTHLGRVLHCAFNVAAQTHGAFDPTLGVAVNSWGFGPPGGKTVGVYGWRHLHIEDGFVAQPGGLHLNLSAIAKGYAVDQLVELLQARGIYSCLVEIGGELRGIGVKPDGQPWWVSVEKAPDAEAESLPELRVALCGMAIATSGDYRQFQLRNGVRFPHTLDSVDGHPIQNGMASVSVLHQECMLADAYSTALSVLGLDDGYEFASQHQLATILVSRVDGQYKWTVSPTLQKMLEME